MSEEKTYKVLDYSIFNPKSVNNIKNDYPELKKYEALSSLLPHDFLFVWWYGCEASPLWKIADSKKRAIEAAKKAYQKGNTLRITRSDYDDICMGRFKPKITSAIQEMNSFKVGPRVFALMAQEKSFQNLCEVLNVELTDARFYDKDGSLDMAKLKNYIDVMEKAQNILPKMIQSMEGKFLSLSKDSLSDDDSFLVENTSLLDSFHEKSE